MHTPTEKKIFPYGNRTYTLVMGYKWYVEYYTPARLNSDVLVRHRPSGTINRTDNPEERMRRALQLITTLAGGASAPKPPKSLLQECLDLDEANLRPKTYHNYNSRLRVFLKWLGKRSEAAVTADDAQAFLTWIIEQGNKGGTVRSYALSLSALYARTKKYSNPFAGVRKPSRKGAVSLLWFRDHHIAALEKHLREKDPQTWLAVQLLFYCFIRPGELRLLQLDDFNLDDGFIEVRGEISKNKKTEKVVIPDALLVELRANPVFQTVQTGLYLFHRKGDWERPVGVNYLYERHAEALEQLRIRGRYSLYSWKHTGVVKAVRAGINLKDLQLQLRHHSLDMVNEYLKDLGVLDSQDLRRRFPRIGHVEPVKPAA